MAASDLIDSHAHLDHEDFADGLEAVLERARDAGVTQIVVVASTLDSARSCVQLAERHGHLFATVGIHPHDVARAGAQDLAAIEALARHPRVVAVGETGLDFHYDFSPRDQQRDTFARTVALARRVGKPLVIHQREAHDDALRILREEGGGALSGVVHCFTGDVRQAGDYIALGLHVSFSGIVTFPKAREIQEAASRVPAERLLVETDCPYLAPIPHRGKRNEPAFVVHTAEHVARLRGVSIESLVATATANTRRLFSIPIPDQSICSDPPRGLAHA